VNGRPLHAERDALLEQQLGLDEIAGVESRARFGETRLGRSAERGPANYQGQ
jgi:hypothetical protein